MADMLNESVKSIMEIMFDDRSCMIPVTAWFFLSHRNLPYD